jgi:hypothetical protein
MTQADQILHYLKGGNKITPLTALKRFGCLRLGARIWDLKRDGVKIKSELVEVGENKRVARYSLA